MLGSGTLLDPYIIQDVNDLQSVNLNLTAYYELGGDIDASVTSGWNGGAGFLPIGTGGSFEGSFCGNNYTIGNLYINRPSTDYVGLFRSGYRTTIRDVNVVNANITGRQETGVFIGYVKETICANCHVSGQLHGYGVVDIKGGMHGGFVGYGFSGGYLYCCSADVVVLSTGDVYDSVGVGGFMGYDLTVPMYFCRASGNVTRQDGGRGIGGFMGHAGLAYYCLATGDVYGPNSWGRIGGFVGASSTSTAYTIQNCHSRGQVTGHPANDTYVGYSGGFAGKIGCGILNSYSTGLVISGTPKGGFVSDIWASAPPVGCFWDTETSGLLTSAGGTGKTTAEMKTQPTFTDAGWDFASIWNMHPSINDGYPFLRWPEQAIAQTLSATNVDSVAGTARINGKVTNTGFPLFTCQYRFRYRIRGGTYNYTAWTNGKVASDTFYADLTGLSRGQYEFSAQVRTLCNLSDWGEPLYFNVMELAGGNINSARMASAGLI